MQLEVAEGLFKSYDGEELFFQTWSKKNPQGFILGVHGMGEHSSCYGFLAKSLENVNLQLVMPDLRGHGRSSGKRGLGSIDEYILDLKILVERFKSDHPHLPLFLLGHSMGGLVVLKYLIRNAEQANAGEISGSILSSPLLGINVEVPFFKKKSARLLSLLAPQLTLSNEIHYKELSHDEKVIKSYDSDNWRHDRVSPRLFLSLTSSMNYVLERCDKIKIPILLQQAGDDRIVSQAKGAEMFEKLKTLDKTIFVYKDMFHEIYNEVGREKVFSDLINWLNHHQIYIGIDHAK
jgi:alpha-beta hydrolase superfamily lysophospholipase